VTAVCDEDLEESKSITDESVLNTLSNKQCIFNIPPKILNKLRNLIITCTHNLHLHVPHKRFYV
jgi:hypothetical protein